MQTCEHDFRWSPYSGHTTCRHCGDERPSVDAQCVECDGTNGLKPVWDSSRKKDAWLCAACRKEKTDAEADHDYWSRYTV